MKNNRLSDEILSKQLIVMSGAEIVELFGHIFSSNSYSTAQSEHSDDLTEYVAGIKGLSDFLGCGTSKAQELKNKGLFDSAIYKIGRKVYFNKNVLRRLIIGKKI